MHFLFKHALFLGQSALMVHSGLQPPTVGDPKNSGKHSHNTFVPCTLQIVFMPHGLGLHKSIGSSRFGIIAHCVKASPVKPSKHEQIGMWLLTVQIALIPQVPGHGS